MEQSPNALATFWLSRFSQYLEGLLEAMDVGLRVTQMMLKGNATCRRRRAWCQLRKHFGDLLFRVQEVAEFREQLRAK